MTSKEEYSYELKIPRSRIAVLIGKDGEIKKDIESATKTTIKVDSKEGDVFISGEDALLLFNTREVIKAIGRGFNPDIAMLLLKGDYILDLVPIEDFIKTKNDLTRAKGRVIGTEGKSRRTLEQLTECNICVFGKTVGIIGQAEFIEFTRRAVENLLKGSPHANVYNWLERMRSSRK